MISADTDGANVETDVVSKSEEVKKAVAEKVEEAKEKIDSAREATVPTEIEVKKEARKAGREMKKAADKAVDTVKRTVKKAKTLISLSLSSPSLVVTSLWKRSQIRCRMTPTPFLFVSTRTSFGGHEEMRRVMWISGNNGIEEKEPIDQNEKAGNEYINVQDTFIQQKFAR